jgi:uncharacterized protein YjdB
MLKSKLPAITGVLVLMAMIFIGCSGGGDGSGTVVSVTGVSLTASDGSNSGESVIYLGGTNANFPASLTFTCTITPQDATNKAVSWTVTPGTYVNWDVATRTVTAKAVGGHTTVTVKTADGNYTAEWIITVADPADYVAVTDVAITNEGSLSFTKTGDDFDPESIQLEYTVSPSTATNKTVNWSVEPAGVVTVSNTGLVTPVAAGNATITITSVDNNEATDTITVTVTDPSVAVVPVTAVSITTEGPLSFTMTGDTFSPASIILTHTVTPSDATYSAVTWSVEPESGVVTVSSAGLVTPVGVGNAVITLTCVVDNTKTDTINVSVTEGSGATVPVTSIAISGATAYGTQKYLYLPINGTAALNAAVNADATDQGVTWSSDRTTGAGTVTVVNGALTAGAAASANGSNPTWTTITAKADGDDAITDTVKVVVLPAAGDTHTTGENWKDTWSFREAIANWMVYESNSPANDATGMTAAATLTGGLKLNAGITIYPATGSSSPLVIRWQPFYTQGAASTSGNIQTGNATLPVTVTGSGGTGDTTFDPADTNRGYFLEIPNVSVPFKITLYYSNTGGNPKRYPIVYADGTHIETMEGTNSTTVINDSVNFYGTGETSATVQLACSGGLRIFDVIIEKIEPLPPSGTISISAANDRTWIWSDAADVPAANKTLQLTAMDGATNITSTATWSVKTTDDINGTDATVASITAGGLLSVTEANLTKTAKVYVFASDGGTSSEEGYMVTVKKIAKVYDFSSATIKSEITTLGWTGSGNYSFPNSATTPVGTTGISVVGAASGTAVYYNAQNSTSVDGFTFTNRIQLPGSSTSIAARAIKFAITGRPNIIIYGRSGGNNRGLGLYRDNSTTNGQLVYNFTAADADQVYTYQYQFTGTDTDLYLLSTTGTFNAVMVIVLETTE